LTRAQIETRDSAQTSHKLLTTETKNAASFASMQNMVAHRHKQTQKKQGQNVLKKSKQNIKLEYQERASITMEEAPAQNNK